MSEKIFAYIPEPWTEDAKCAYTETPDDWDVANLAHIRKDKRRRAAQDLCQGCPVIGKCADLAYKHRAVGMVYAGIPLGTDPFYNDYQYAELLEIREREKWRMSQK